MELFYSLTSPYSRKILLVLKHLGMDDKVTLTPINPLLDDTARLTKVNPLGKIPALILDNGEVIFDSPLIVEVLFHMVEGPALSFEERLKQQKLHALADGMMDAAVSAQMERRRPDAEPSAFWMTRWRDALLRALAEVEKNMIRDADDWHIGSMALACALDYICFRHPDIAWRNDRPLTFAWYRTAMRKDIMIKTDPRQAQ